MTVATLLIINNINIQLADTDYDNMSQNYFFFADNTVKIKQGVHSI